MAYAIQFNTADVLAATLNSGATSTTLTAGNFGSPSGAQLYVVDYDVPAKAEIILATVAGTSVTSITRGLTGGASGTTDHAIGAKIGSIFVPQHYDRVANRTLGYTQITGNLSTASTTAIQATGLTATVTIPTGGARIKITAFTRALYNSTDGFGAQMSIWDGTVGSGTLLSLTNGDSVNTNAVNGGTAMAVLSPSAGSKTYNVGILANGGGTANLEAGATYPAFILVENIE